MAAVTVPYSKLLARAIRLIQSGDPGAADAICRHVLAVDPAHSTALYISGLIAHDLGDHARSFEMMDRAIALQPDFADAYCGRGVARRHLRQPEAALEDFRRAVALDPKQARAHLYIGLSLLEQSALAAAAEHFEAALSHEPTLAMALANLGLVRHRQQRLDEAVQLYQRTLAIEPSLTPTLNNLAGALQELGRAAEALEILHRVDAQSMDPVVGMNVLTCLNLVPGTPQEFHVAAKSWASRFADPLARPMPHRSRDPDRRLRVGYIAAQGLRRHTLAMTYLPLFEAHDPAQVETFAYSDLPEHQEDAVTARARAVVSTWRRTAGLDDDALADRIMADEIDILVDGIGFAAGSRLLAAARRPAPVQIHFPTMSTTGMTAFDYVFGDDNLLPHPVDGAFTERPWRLACGFLYRPTDSLPALVPPPAVRNGFITFGSFNRIAKIGPESIALWAAVLKQVPTSRLIIKSTVDISDESARRYRELFAKHGVDQDRLLLGGADAGELHAFNDIDIALDTVPFGGVLTTCAALAMGVPVVSWVGARVLERYGAAILTAARFTDGLAADQQTYVMRAAELARAPARLAALRPQLRGQLLGSPLCDGPTFARSVEHAYRAMWRRWCAGQAPGNVQAKPETRLS